jgi:hypothetical protein
MVLTVLWRRSLMATDGHLNRVTFLVADGCAVRVRPFERVFSSSVLRILAVPGWYRRLRAAIGRVRTEDAELLDRLSRCDEPLDYLTTEDLLEIAAGVTGNLVKSAFSAAQSLPMSVERRSLVGSQAEGREFEPRRPLRFSPC